MGAALNEVLRRIRHELDQMVRTGGHTFAAGHTFLLIDNSHTVNHVNGVKGAGLHAGAISHTAVDAGFLSGARYDCDLPAVVHTVIVVLNLRLIAGTFTLYKSHFLHCVSAVHTHDGADSARCRCSAYRTGIHGRFTGGDCLSQSVTARISAAAAVIARQLIAHENLFFICFYFKFFAGHT